MTANPSRQILAGIAALTVVVLTLVAVLTAAGGGANATDPVLGSPGYDAPGGTGWGTAQPAEIYNGGDPAGDAGPLAWKHWGDTTARATGLIPIFRPGGGYYARPGHLVLRATRLGTCADGTYAYTRLWFRVSRTPDGPVGRHWHRWADTGDICENP